MKKVLIACLALFLVAQAAHASQRIKTDKYGLIDLVIPIDKQGDSITFNSSGELLTSSNAVLSDTAIEIIKTPMDYVDTFSFTIAPGDTKAFTNANSRYTNEVSFTVWNGDIHFTFQDSTPDTNYLRVEEGGGWVEDAQNGNNLYIYANANNSGNVRVTGRVRANQ